MKSAFSTHPRVGHAGVAQRIQGLLPSLPRQEGRVAQYMLLNLDDLAFQTGVSIAKKTGTSQVTVSRLLSRLGYRGMAGLKRELQSQRATAGLGNEVGAETIENDPLKPVLDAEVRALVGVFSQCTGERWAKALDVVAGADAVFVTGFQTVRGAAEDFARRLALVRDDVRALSAHDGMLAEWIGNGGARSERRECLIVIDVVPYAQEAPLLAEMSRAAGRDVVVLTDEFCQWARPHTDLVFHAPSRSGLFLESTGALVSLANLLVHGVAERDQAATERRLRRWHGITRKLNVF